MADKEISELTAADTLDGSELVHVDQDGNSRRATLLEIAGLATGAMLVATYDPDANGIIAVAQGGTNAATASGARTNLGLGTMAVQGAGAVAITGGSVTGITDITVADGGTGASTASGARTNLGLVIGTDVQAYSANLAGFAATTVANVQNRDNHTGTQLAATISDFSTAADLRVSAAIGSTVQAYSALLDSVSALSLTAGDIIYATGEDAVAVLPAGASGQVLAVDDDGVPAWDTSLVVGGLIAANNLSDVDDAADALTNLGAGAAGQAIFADALVADVRTYILAAPYVASLASLKALDTTKDAVARFDGDHWDWLTGDYSTQVAADTVGAIFAKADAIATTSGAWARRGGYLALGRAKFDWFAVPATGASDATTAFETMLTICEALGITRIKAAEKGIYALQDAAVPAGSFDIDWNGSLIQGTYTAQVAFTSIGDMTGGGGLAEAGDDDLSHTYAESANVAAANGYVGRTFTTPSVVRGAVVVGSSDQGYATGSNPSVTITLYGKTGAAPANGTDGTSLGSITFTDSASETSGRIITSNDKTTLFDHTWVYVSTAAAAGVCIAEFSPDSGSRNILTATSGTSDHTLTFRNAIFDGGWDGADTTAETSEKVIAIKGYGRLEMHGCTLQNCAKGGASETAFFDRSDMALDIWNVGLTVLNGLTVKDTRRYEAVLIKSDDATHLAEVSGCVFLNSEASGSHFSVFNLGGLKWRDGYVDGANAGPNVLAEMLHIDNVHFRNITDNGLDCFEAAYYTKNGLIENCSFTDIDDVALTVSGNTTVRNCHFDTCGVPIAAGTEISAGATESAPGAGDAAWGPWLAQVEAAINIVVEDCTFAGTMAGAGTIASCNIRVAGSATNFATFSIRGADTSASATCDYGVISRYIKRGTFTGSWYCGTESIFRHDLNTGTYVLDGDFNPVTDAHVFLLNRASAVATSATVHWTALAMRHGSLAASHYDIAIGTATGYTAIHFDSPTKPEIQPSIPSSALKGLLSGSAAYNPGSIADGASSVPTDITVTGAALGNTVELAINVNTQGLRVFGWVSAADTVSVRYENETGGAIDLANHTISVWVRKR